MARYTDGVHRDGISTALDTEGVCDWCGGSHTVCRDERTFAKQVSAAFERLYGPSQKWGSGNAQGRHAAAYRARGKATT